MIPSRSACARLRSAGAPHHSARWEWYLCVGQSEEHGLEDGREDRSQTSFQGSGPCPEPLEGMGFLSVPTGKFNQLDGRSLVHWAAGQLAVPPPGKPAAPALCLSLSALSLLVLRWGPREG